MSTPQKYFWKVLGRIYTNQECPSLGFFGLSVPTSNEPLSRTLPATATAATERPAPFSTSLWRSLVLLRRKWKPSSKKSTAMALCSDGFVSRADTVSRPCQRRPAHWPKSSVPSGAENKIFNMIKLSLPPTPEPAGMVDTLILFLTQAVTPCC